MWAITDNSLAEHEALMEPAGVSELLRHTGYLKVFRNHKVLDAAVSAHKEGRTYSDVRIIPVTAGLDKAA
jgi:hypothetical protein